MFSSVYVHNAARLALSTRHLEPRDCVGGGRRARSPLRVRLHAAHADVAQHPRAARLRLGVWRRGWPRAARVHRVSQIGAAAAETNAVHAASRMVT